MNCTRCGSEPRWTSSSGRTYYWGRACLNETKRAWNAANPEKRRASQRVRQRRWMAAHPELQKARVAACMKANPEPGREHVRRRRSAKAGILMVVKVDAAECGVCQRPLTDERSPHPLSTEIGHEPPLKVAKRDGWGVIVERPEHRHCNRRKSDRTDAELGYAFVNVT